MFGPKKFSVYKKIFESIKILGPKRFWVKKSKKKIGQQIWKSKKFEAETL